MVYVADTGATRVVPDPATGRLVAVPAARSASLTTGASSSSSSSIEKSPQGGKTFSVFADGDAPGAKEYVPFTSPDNIGTSANSLMVQGDFAQGNAAIWWYDFNNDTWSVVATVNDPDGESSGIVDASPWFGPGAWILDVQGHGRNVDEEVQPTACS